MQDMTCPPASPVKQLRTGSPTASVDCGVAVTAMCLRHALCDQIDPSVAALRRRGEMGDGPTGIAHWKAAIATYGPEAAALGYETPAMFNLGYIERDAIMAQLARRLSMLAVILSYAVLQEPEWRAYRSDDYTGGHAVAVRGLYRTWGTGYRRIRARQLPNLNPALKLWVEVLDPLADGRRPAIPQAPQKWPLDLLLKAGDAFSSRSGTLAAVIYRAGRLP